MRVVFPTVLLAICATLSSPVLGGESQSKANKELTKQPGLFGKNLGETTPIFFQGRQLLVQCTLWGSSQPDPNALVILIHDPATGEELARFGQRHGLASALVEGDTVHVFATECLPAPSGIAKDNWFQDIYRFSSTDLKNWKRELALPRSGDEHLLNSSVCRDEQGYLMAYESDKPVKFCFKFARSKDLSKWEKIDGLVFAGPTGKEYSACPVIRYLKPYYYTLYVSCVLPNCPSFVARSTDLKTWQRSPRYPVLEVGKDEGSCVSDFDLIEIDGKTYVYYNGGNQATWANVKQAIYPGPMREFFEAFYLQDAVLTEIDARAAHPSSRD